MRLLAVLILSFYSLIVFSDDCPSGYYPQDSDIDENLLQIRLKGYRAPPTSFIDAQYMTVLGRKRNDFNANTSETVVTQLYTLCRLPAPVKCDPETQGTFIGKFGINYSCFEKCPDGYEKNQAGQCVDPNGCTEDKFLKGGQCSDRCSEYGTKSTGYNAQTKDCNFTDQCGAMQKRDRINLSSPTGIGTGGCYDDPNGCPSGYSFLPVSTGGSACTSTTSTEINSVCPSGTKIVGDGSTGQCQADGTQNTPSTSSSTTSSSGAPPASSSGGTSTSSSGIPGSTSSSGGATSSGGDSGGSGGSGSSLTTSGGTSTASGSSASGIASTGGTVGASSGGTSSGSSSGGQTGGYSGRCDVPPQCQNSASIECAQLYQTWFAGCPLKGYTHQAYVDPVEDGKSEVRKLFDGFKTRVTKAPTVAAFTKFLKFNKSGSCPTWSIELPWFSATFDYLCSPIIPWGAISGVLIACSLLVAFRLAAK